MRRRKYEGHEQDEEHNDDEEEGEKDVVSALQERTPVRRALGSFMTPQHPSSTFDTHRKLLGAMGPPPQPPQGRYSLGGGEAHRLRTTTKKYQCQLHARA
jgi:hypothetical protein